MRAVPLGRGIFSSASRRFIPHAFYFSCGTYSH